MHKCPECPREFEDGSALSMHYHSHILMDTDNTEIIDNPYNTVRFTGGPLDGQTRQMEVYVGVIPDPSQGYLDWGNTQPRAYYQNVNAVAGVDRQLQQKGFVHYVYFIEGKRA